MSEEAKISASISARWSLATEGGNAGEYDPVLQPKLRAEAVRVFRAFGFASGHAVIVGGLVPSLLVPNVEPGIEPHVGTQDLDLCLSVALVEGDVGNYERLEKALKDAKFSMAYEDGHSVSWRWQGGVDLPLIVEFFCPEAPGREAGRLYRPGGVVGGKLSAMVISAGRLIDRDTREIELEVDLPGGGGHTRQKVRAAGPAAYLASKADALRRRNKNKDAYDIVWLAEAWPGGQARACVLAATGNREEAVKLARELLERSRREPIRSGILAVVYVLLGDRDHAFELLDRAFEEKEWTLRELKVGPIWDTLRDDPRFVKLLAKMNLN